LGEETLSSFNPGWYGVAALEIDQFDPKGRFKALQDEVLTAIDDRQGQPRADRLQLANVLRYMEQAVYMVGIRQRLACAPSVRHMGLIRLWLDTWYELQASGGGDFSQPGTPESCVEFHAAFMQWAPEVLEVFREKRIPELRPVDNPRYAFPDRWERCEYRFI
jgi:hypothetical protein